jgi:hypothetical protein
LGNWENLLPPVCPDAGEKAVTAGRENGKYTLLYFQSNMVFCKQAALKKCRPAVILQLQAGHNLIF